MPTTSTNGPPIGIGPYRLPVKLEHSMQGVLGTRYQVIVVDIDLCGPQYVQERPAHNLCSSRHVNFNLARWPRTTRRVTQP